jgi:hypothetical protein
MSNGKLRARYSSDKVFTVFNGDYKLAWVQWSELYKLWRVVICDTGDLHMVPTVELVMDAIKFYFPLDDNIEHA